MELKHRKKYVSPICTRLSGKSPNNATHCDAPIDCSAGGSPEISTACGTGSSPENCSGGSFIGEHG